MDDVLEMGKRARVHDVSKVYSPLPPNRKIQSKIQASQTNNTYLGKSSIITFGASSYVNGLLLGFIDCLIMYKEGARHIHEMSL